MKNLVNILTIIAIVCMFGCKKNDNTPEKEKVTYNKTIVEYYYPAAEYVTTTTDTFNLTSLDTSFVSVQYGGLLNINTAQTSIKFKHLGGWIDTVPPAPYDAASEILYDPEIYDIDTIYDTISMPLSYLIYEIDDKNGLMGRLDTAILWKDINLKRNHDLESCMTLKPTDQSVYLPNINGYYEAAYSSIEHVASSQTLEYFTFWLNLLEQMPLHEPDIDIRVFDIFPYWQSPITSAEIIFYINK